MEITGVIKRIQPTQVVSDKFQKRELHIETDGQYPQTICVEFTQDKCSVLDNYAAGQSVKIGIDLRGREWTSPQGELRVFNTIQGWRIDAEGAAPQQAATTAPQQKEDDGLPW